MKPLCGIIALLLLLMLDISTVRAQREFNIWCFGDSAGLDFNDLVSGGPVPLPLTGMRAGEGSASVADRNTGELLFYSNGEIVWNREHQVMPDGSGLKAGFSSTQAALIVPVPGDSMRYYLFGSAHEATAGSSDGVVYSIIDMRADGGRGDVVLKNVPLIAPATEKLVAVPRCDGTGFWVITHTPGDDRFHAFAVTAAGVAATPVVSATGDTHRESRNWLAASPNGRMLAASVPFGRTELFDFDPCTGAVSNSRVLLQRHSGYGICFSPDNTRLYTISDSGASRLLQFDLTDDNRITLVTLFTVSPSLFNYPAAMQIGPDGRIYCGRGNMTWIGVIDRPNEAGLACNFIDSGQSLGGRNCFWGLPNVITGLYVPPHTSMSISDSALCAGACTEFSASVTGVATGVRWLFPGGMPASYEGEGPVRVCYDAPGVYTAKLIAANGFGADTTERLVTIEDGVPATALAAGTISGAPGEIIDIPVLVHAAVGEAVPVGSYMIRLRFNGTLLRPVGVDSTISMAYDGGECLVTLRGSGSGSGDTLCRLRMEVGLGNAETTRIEFDTVAWAAGCTEHQVMLPGEFQLTGVCREGSPRLFTDMPASALKSCIYDRGTGMIDVRYTTGGEPAQLVLTDILGRRVAGAALDDGVREERVMRFDATNIPAGMYFCMLHVAGRDESMVVHIRR